MDSIELIETGPTRAKDDFFYSYNRKTPMTDYSYLPVDNNGYPYSDDLLFVVVNDNIKIAGYPYDINHTKVGLAYRNQTILQVGTVSGGLYTYKQLQNNMKTRVDTGISGGSISASNGDLMKNSINNLACSTFIGGCSPNVPNSV